MGRTFGVTVLVAAWICVASRGTAAAATFTVDTVVDAVDAVAGDGVCATASAACSLRAAVQEANALAGPDEIVLGPGSFLLTLAGIDSAAAVGDLDIADDVTVSGAGQGVTVIASTVDDRVFELLGALSLSVSDLSISGGNPGGTVIGGGILAVDLSSVVVLTDVTLSDNHAQSGGGLLSQGTATLLRVTVVDNSAAIGGGGALLRDADIRDSGFGGNSSDTASLDSSDIMGSGIGTITISNSTFDGIVASLSYCFPPPDISCGDGPAVALRNVTVSELQRYEYGGPSHGPTTVRNSIVLACGGTVTSEGHNLFETAGCTIVGDSTGNQVGVPAGLLPFADYGGQTPSRPPMGDSTAIDAGHPGAPGSGGTTCEPFDQRQQARPLGAACDIGAIETACGDGVPQPEEECDDGNAVDGDGCDTNCTVSACGNGIAAGGEDCDDGNTLDGDCCSSSCSFDPMGTSCASDGNQCTADQCDGSGTCLHDPVAAGTSCNDANACTSDDQCDGAGACIGTYCDFCYSCNTSTGCFVPDCGEVAATKAKLRLRRAGGGTNDSLRISWKGGPLDKIDLPDPEGGALRLCVYDGDDGLMVGASAEDACSSTGDCWTDKTSGFVFKDKARQPDGLLKMKLKAGNTSSMKAVGKGAELALGNLAVATPVRMRLFRAQFGSCVAADFSTVRESSVDKHESTIP